MKSRYHIILLFTLIFIKCFSQNHILDSLRHVMKSEKEDTNKINALNIFSKKMALSSADTSLACANSAKELAEELDYKKGIAEALSNIGFVNSAQGNYPLALENVLKALSISQEIGNKYDIGENLRIVGVINLRQENYSNALGYFLKALKIFQDINDKNRIARVLINIGLTYRFLDNDTKSIEYDTLSLNISRQIGDQEGMEVDLDNIGGLYNDIANHYRDDTNYTYAQKYYQKAQGYYLMALSLARELGVKNNVSSNMCSIASIYISIRNYKMARTYLDSSLALSLQLNEKEIISVCYLYLSEVDNAVGNYEAALADYKKYFAYRDSMMNDANTKKMLQMQMSYDFGRKTDSAKAAQDKLNLIAAKESQHQKTILYIFIGGFVVMLMLAFLIFIGYNQKQNANLVITRQKELVEGKNKEILDSINYAKRLQEAILPPFRLIKKSFPESFVFYSPKDIVAGDFYWMEQVGDNILIAAADCTGHGVPGALVSVICSNALNRTVKEFHTTEPGKILDKVSELVLETFEKSESNVQDGMDISLFCINTIANEIQWSGAYNPLWYIRKGKMHEVSGDKQPIGRHDNHHPFQTHTFKLEKGDVLYLFTDGYADQFGGPKGKKFKYKQLQELLLTNALMSMEAQKAILERKLDDWKGKLEQVDDILVIGVRV